MTTKQITPIETIEETDRSDETVEMENLENTVEFENREDENEFYLNILYQMCVAA
jgi:hypothetical protein